MIVKALMLALALQAAPGGLPPEEEARAQALMREVRCMVCAGESVMDSNAPMAQDMRRFIREQVAVGQTDADLRQAMVERFGHEVLMRPTFDARTAPLWIAPLILMLLGGALFFTAMRKPRTRP
ncbi:cytochrome c-type biogenesis protein CcmH [Hyphomonadaceae bacterium BL14]|nr:cytochrome c-type biogenesis protein CcmH [Hyphomonadaceae bacterium BL14]